jgi:predicted metal-dependent enzyme (double-stranded beta helix superfamily)
MPLNELTHWCASVEAIISRHQTSTHTELETLCEALRQAAASPGMQLVLRTKAEEARSSYRRWLVSEGSKFSAILIGWPPGFTTPIHDHDGLWGIELVLCGTLHVDEFELDGSAPRPMSALDLSANTAAIFDNPGYAHACSNRSLSAPALSLHVYGGVLSAYTVYPAAGTLSNPLPIRAQTATECIEK